MLQYRIDAQSANHDHMVSTLPKCCLQAALIGRRKLWTAHDRISASTRASFASLVVCASRPEVGKQVTAVSASRADSHDELNAHVIQMQLPAASGCRLVRQRVGLHSTRHCHDLYFVAGARYDFRSSPLLRRCSSRLDGAVFPSRRPPSHFD